MFVKPLLFFLTLRLGLIHIFFIISHKTLLIRERERAVLPFSLPICTNGIQDIIMATTAAYLTPRV